VASLARDRLVLAAVVLGTFAAVMSTGLAGAAGAASVAASCAEETVRAFSVADSWIGENVTSNKGADVTLDVEADPSAGHSRALVRFPLPAGVPDGCVLASAKLRLFTSSGSEGSRVEVVRLASAWSESQVLWSNQPSAVGVPATAWSADGYMQWNVLGLVQTMLEAGNHGFLVRDAAEGTEEGGAGHGFSSRENGEDPPELVLRFAAPPSGTPDPPAPPVPAVVRCGEVLTRSTLVTNDLAECPGDGLVIGAPRVIVDLAGHTIDGVGLGAGVLNDGFASVTVRNGTLQDFDHGVVLLSETESNVVEGLTLRENELAAVRLFDARAGNLVRENMVVGNGEGVALVSGSTGTVVEDNEFSLNSGASLLLRDANDNLVEDNDVLGGGDLGIGLERASGNTLVDNDVAETSDGGIELRDGSHANRIEDNDLSASGDTGIMVDSSDRNELIANTARLMSDSGITLVSANDGVVAANDLRGSTGGLQMDGSSRNRVEANMASDSSGIGIELGGDSYGNLVVFNRALDNGAAGIYLADEALTAPGNFVAHNVASRNGSDGIVLAKGGHVLAGNVARGNGGWGILAAPGTIDGGRNLASGNGQPGQCSGVPCSDAAAPPDTTLVAHPDSLSRSTSATFSFSGIDDGVGPEPGFQCRLDSQIETDFAACSSPRSYVDLAPGSHTFEVRAVVGADVDPTPALFTWTVDNIPPDTSIVSGPDATSSSASAVFAFAASEPGSTFACSLDGAAFAACGSPRGYGGLAVDAHRFEVRATDPAGNTDLTPARHTWRISTPTPPPGAARSTVWSGWAKAAGRPSLQSVRRLRPWRSLSSAHRARRGQVSRWSSVPRAE
jgi:parallel beta-helix repeat protein